MTQMDYRKKLGLSVNDHIKVARFYAQMHNYFTGAGSVEFDGVIEHAFCDRIGVPIDQTNQLVEDIWSGPTGLEQAWVYLKECKTDFLELLYRCVTLINIYPKSQRMIREGLQTVILNALDDCQIAYDLFNDDDGVFIFPKGAEELDQALVSEPLEWLSDYPKSRIAFVKALKEYSDATPDTSSDVADKFRKALETFFQEFFGGGRSLEKYVLDHTYAQYLDKCGVPSDMRDEFKNTVSAYAKFINNNAKHHDKTELKVLEYLMYQTGNIIRLLITLRQGEQTDAD